MRWSCGSTRGHLLPARTLRLWLPLVTRPLSHPGNYKYAWLIHRGLHARQLLNRTQSYHNIIPVFVLPVGG